MASRIIGASSGRVIEPERLPAVDAVELGRLIEIGRNRRQPGEQDDEHERRPLPDVGEDQREVDPGLCGQPADRDFAAEELAEQIVGRTERPLQEQRPGLADDHRADEQRDDQDRHDQAAAAESASPSRAPDARPSRNSMVTLAADSIDGEDQRPARHRIEHHLREILQADEGVAGDLKVVVDEGDPTRTAADRPKAPGSAAMAGATSSHLKCRSLHQR